MEKVQGRLDPWGLGGHRKEAAGRDPSCFRGLVTKCLLSLPGHVTGNTKDTAKKVILNLIVPVPFVECL